jgi:putative ABC transport system ATP-binding protein
MSDIILCTDRLTRQVAGKRLVDRISIEIQRGVLVAIVGPSGSGKSSFLRLLNRLDEPTEGTVLLQGQDYRSLPPPELRRRVGMVMQFPYLFPGTVADNVQYGPQQRGESLPGEAIDQLLDGVGMTGYADRLAVNLSGGEAQRVSLARALANSPQILLLDEPTSSLDEENERDVEALIASIQRSRGLTCLMVTHDIDQARRLASQVVVMEAGRMVAFGPVANIL